VVTKVTGFRGDHRVNFPTDTEGLTGIFNNCFFGRKVKHCCQFFRVAKAGVKSRYQIRLHFIFMESYRSGRAFREIEPRQLSGGQIPASGGLSSLSCQSYGQAN